MIDDGAVGGYQILDGPTAGGGIGVDARMVGGNEFIIQHHGVRSGTAKCDGVAGQRDGTAGKGAIDNDQQSWFGIGCGACRRGCGGYASCGSACARFRRRAGDVGRARLRGRHVGAGTGGVARGVRASASGIRAGLAVFQQRGAASKARGLAAGRSGGGGCPPSRTQAVSTASFPGILFSLQTPTSHCPFRGFGASWFKEPDSAAA